MPMPGRQRTVDGASFLYPMHSHWRMLELGSLLAPAPACQDDKERLRAQLALASQGSGASEARLAEKDEALAQLQ